ncbi:succinate dehydrogenase assembly factor 1, mitochondrial [Platysternon megacephalum]|uniref:Succinate dehydrogenase assembly factor 1, mitochondrial n=1 Tax=Platysternon megacephalum TaxID=55544 RepID=A0A4D9DRD3_9SAUR|nr:succinate dehydrogenase assembly factor 1, mitochondrial [Platysternon megacephalum]
MAAAAGGGAREEEEEREVVRVRVKETGLLRMFEMYRNRNLIIEKGVVRNFEKSRFGHWIERQIPNEEDWLNQAV